MQDAQLSGEAQNQQPEEALHSEDVLELQAFIERKEWIRDKISLLEAMPPLEIFAGLEDMLLDDYKPTPTREQLATWFQEHDQIEKETEQFDAGDMIKLKKFAKAATQRNLSPSDTDLIEVTLETLVALDKLLHLLRTRSDGLELVTLRLDWQDLWCGGWKELQKITKEIRQFLETRANWSPDAYQKDNRSHDPSGRADLSSKNPSSPLATAVISPTSRSSRFRHVEVLSHDAAQFSSRLNTLKHTKVVTSAKVLERIIEQSRNPVPEICLDQQDSLENQFNVEMEGAGKFVMAVVMQWKKADELHGEALKDQQASRTLLDEIERAQGQHPTSRLAGSFASRSQTLISRTMLRGNPASLTSSFPRPQHPAFPDQITVNSKIIDCLTAEILAAKTFALQTQSAMKDYQKSLQTVEEAEGIQRKLSDLENAFSGLRARLQGVENRGSSNRVGELLPPDLSKCSLLDPSQHSAYLALFPSITSDLEKINQHCQNSLQTSQQILLLLKASSADEAFVSGLVKHQQALEEAQLSVNSEHDNIQEALVMLRGCRKIWESLQHITDSLQTIQCDVDAAFIALSPKRPISVTPPPENEALSSLATHALRFREALSLLRAEMQNDVIERLKGYLELPEVPTVVKFLQSYTEEVRKHLMGLDSLIGLLDKLESQSSTILVIREEARILESRFLHLVSNIEKDVDGVLARTILSQDYRAVEAARMTETESLREDLRYFLELLPTRLNFVGDYLKPSKPTTENLDFGTYRLPQLRSADPAINVKDVEAGTRQEMNTAIAILQRLSDQVTTRMAHFRLATIAQSVDDAVAVSHAALSEIEATVGTYQTRLNASISSTSSATVRHALLKEVTEMMSQRSPSIPCALQNVVSPAQDCLSRLLAQSTATGDPIILSRMQGVDDLDARRRVILDAFTSVQASATSALSEIEHRASVSESALLSTIDTAFSKYSEIEALLSRYRSQFDTALLLKSTTAELQELQSLVSTIDDVSKTISTEVRSILQSAQESMSQMLEHAINLDHETTSGTTQKLVDLEAQAQALLAALISLQELVLQRFHEIQQSANETQKNDADKALFVTEGVDGVRELENSEDKLSIASASCSTDNESDANILRRLAALRDRLRNLCLESLVHPPQNEHCAFPSSSTIAKCRDEVDTVRESFGCLQPVAKATHDDHMYTDFLEVLEQTNVQLSRLQGLDDFIISVGVCDAAFSDLLDGIDKCQRSESMHNKAAVLSPGGSALGRLVRATEEVVVKVQACAVLMKDDTRVDAEVKRIHQTWIELREMAEELIGEPSSQPPSGTNSGRNSVLSSTSSDSRFTSKWPTSRPPSTDVFLSPKAPMTPIRSVSARQKAISPTKPFARSVSGPLSGWKAPQSTTLLSSTFSSRSRTTSLSSNSGNISVPVPRTPSRQARSSSRSYTRTVSPTVSEASSTTFMTNPSKAAPRTGSFGRAPRLSFGAHSQREQARPIKKKYVANPSSKLDMAVGKVVNDLPVNISIEAVPDGWKDQSGKYWIGDDNPKLCFCRILRSQTVMVRVGGGWVEMSRFIKDHFGDAFRILPDPTLSPMKEPQWISASTLEQNSESVTPPRNGENFIAPIPSLSLSTPSGKRTPQSLEGSPQGNTPLTPFQFMRKAEDNAPLLGSPTPQRWRTPRKARGSLPSSPAYPSVWRP